LVDPSEPGSQEINKRVDIVVLSTLPEENEELLDQVAFDRQPEAATREPGRRPAHEQPATHEPAAEAATPHAKSEEH
jgi:hypothetical protein